MARGGARVGAGRKPKKGKGKVLGMPGVTPPAAGAGRSAPKPDRKLVTPPRHLSEEEREVWKRLAPLAIKTGMLTPETAPGLEYLCTVTVTFEELRKTLKDEGWQIILYQTDEEGHRFPLEQKRHPLWPQLQAFAVRREQALARFGLLANGKVSPQPQAPAANPWEHIG